ncbi:hypothetical protein Tsubulata_010650 [Turnera subulata]|uniref:RING-type domain-containing protein n=1 Tax=Turnera subulata TaxID=218843 RepID=A0A9Q0J9W5_9ROSI|nr:hypothetical protein Tsubulata_010650 [Turnera subulata]
MLALLHKFPKQPFLLFFSAKTFTRHQTIYLSVYLVLSYIQTNSPVMMKRWFSGMTKVSFGSTRVVSLCIAAMEGFGTVFSSVVLKKAAYASLTCILALGGALVGTVVGALKGHTTETGFIRGSGIGAVAGALTAVQLLESMADGEPLSKGALLCSLMNGKIFTEWVSPAVLKAYQWQISAVETSYGEISDIYEANGVIGLSQDQIRKLPRFTFKCSNLIEQWQEFSCSICLQELKDGDSMRRLPYCGHFFHLDCLDQWLIQNGSCPMCRNCLCVCDCDDPPTPTVL